ncbi:MAG: formate--phosphoribosylaminoimidazolecarboxamide ligase [Candidatus Altiarchaeota archaeon]
MVEKKEIDKILKGYNKRKIRIVTLCSHTSLQIFFGAKQEGFKTLGICKPEIKRIYDKFPLAKPDEFLLVDSYDEILSDSFQEKLRRKNSVVIPHGSFVEYVGARNIEHNFLVPIFGSRDVLEWESDRKKQKYWLEKAGIKTPREFSSPKEIDTLAIVKFPGAKGGKGYFLVKNEKELYEKIKEKNLEEKKVIIQEYILGARFYPHYFHSILNKETELMSMDIRYETNIEGLIRSPLLWNEVEPSFVVTGNTPVIARESLLLKILEIGENVVEASKKLFSPGIYGPFCVETICTPDLEFFVFEISARIVAGTNLYISGSPYSTFRYKEPMSTGRRIAREIKIAIKKGLLNKILC